MSSNTYLKNFPITKTSIEEKIRKEREEGKKRREIEKKYEKYLGNILYDGYDNVNPLNIFYINLLKSKLIEYGLRYPYIETDKYLQRKEIQHYITELKIRIKLDKEEVRNKTISVPSSKSEIQQKYEKYLENIFSDSHDDLDIKSLYKDLLKLKLTRIGLKYPYDDIDRYLQRKEIQEYITELKIINKLTKQERDKLDKTIGKRSNSKILQELSKSKSDIYKKVIKRFEKEESNLDKELKRTTGIIKDISGLTDEEFEAIIDTVLKATNERINNKKEYLQLTEKIIQFLNKSLSKSPLIIDLPLEEFKQKYI